jgi:hypothetical protein
MKLSSRQCLAVHLVLFIGSHRGIPSLRKGMEFGVSFAGSEHLWIPYSTTDAFETYCRVHPEL